MPPNIAIKNLDTNVLMQGKSNDLYRPIKNRKRNYSH